MTQQTKQLGLDLKAPSNERFDIKRDIAIEKAGGIFCHGCLSGRTDRSADPRYCQRCFEFLRKEAELLPPGKRPRWTPKCPPRASGGLATGRSEAQKSIPVS